MKRVAEWRLACTKVEEPIGLSLQSVTLSKADRPSGKYRRADSARCALCALRSGQEDVLTRQNHSWIFVIEDSESDLYLLKRALGTGPDTEQVVRARDGEQGIELLDELASAGRAWLPDLIVLDLNLPRVDGHGVLAHLRAHRAFHEIPVIVVTCSEAEAERKRALAGGADGYFVKPFDLASYRHLPAAIADARRVRSERLMLPWNTNS